MIKVSKGHHIIRQSFGQCQKWRRFATSVIAGLVISMGCAESAFSEDLFRLEDLNPNKRHISRGPTNFVPDDQVDDQPIEQKIWLKNLLVEDNSGVLQSTRKDLNRWEETERYAKNWNLESTGLYVTPSRESKKNYVMKKLLKYADKRLSGEIKSAEEGSTLHRVGQIEKALKPKASVQVSSKIKVKFKARVLQRRAIILVDNPYVEYNTNINSKGRVHMYMGKKLEDIGVETAIDYEVNDGVYVARIDKELTSTVKARLTSDQGHDTAPFAAKSDKTIQLLYSKPF